MNKLFKSTAMACALVFGASAFAVNAVEREDKVYQDDAICIGVSAGFVFIEYCFDI